MTELTSYCKHERMTQTFEINCIFEKRVPALLTFSSVSAVTLRK